MSVRCLATRLIPAAVAAVIVYGFAGSAPAAAPTLSDASASGTAARDVEPTVWFQGYLADASTSEPIDAVYDVYASIYSDEAGGSLIWGPELHSDVPVVDGWFNIELGTVTPPLPDFATPGYYLELEINGELLVPRSKLASVPSALLSSETIHPDADWAIDGSDIYHESGHVGVGTATPGTELDVDGTVRTTGFQLTTSPSAGSVLTSDASGIGTWQTAPGGVGGGGTAGYLTKFNAASTIGNSAAYESEGRIAIGTATTTGGKLTVENAGLLPTLALRNTASQNGQTMLYLQKTEPLQSSDDVLSLWIPSTSTSGTFIRCGREDEYGFSTAFWVMDDGEIMANGGADIEDYEDAKALYVASYADNPEARGIEAHCSNLNASNGVAVYGDCTPSDYHGSGGLFEGGYIGAKGMVVATGSHSYYGVQGRAEQGTGTCYGVAGSASGDGTNYGVYGEGYGGANNWAGYFSGSVRVTGTIVNPAAMLEIDDPSDPAGSYLRHPYVASSEMKTVYDGTVVLDSEGQAWVEMPDWCEALNGDFRYQLTPVGAPGPNLYIADELSGRRFRIAGGEPGMRVCWMLTGVRRDPSASSRSSDVRVPKAGDDVGRFLDPAAYGAPSSEGIGAIRDEKFRR